MYFNVPLKKKFNDDCFNQWFRLFSGVPSISPSISPSDKSTTFSPSISPTTHPSSSAPTRFLSKSPSQSPTFQCITVEFFCDSRNEFNGFYILNDTLFDGAVWHETGKKTMLSPSTLISMAISINEISGHHWIFINQNIPFWLVSENLR